MTTIELCTESYIFESSEGQLRAIPFYELSLEEWVIFQNGRPKYFLDFNRRTSPLIMEIRNRIEKGEDFEAIINQFGRYLGIRWSIMHDIQGEEIAGSERPEKVIVKRIDDLSEIAVELTFIAPDHIENEDFFNNQKLFDNYLIEDENGKLGIETCIIDGDENFEKLMNFIFGKSEPQSVLLQTSDNFLYDLTEIRTNCITFEDLESQYDHWIELSDRENSMDEYGTLFGIIDFVQSNLRKNYLLLRVGARHWHTF